MDAMVSGDTGSGEAELMDAPYGEDGLGVAGLGEPDDAVVLAIASCCSLANDMT